MENSNKNNIRYKKILFFVVLIEFILGGIFIYKEIKKIITTKKTKVSVIDKSKINIDENSIEIWRYKPYEKVTDHPYWLEQEVVYHINEDGLNDLNDYSIEKDDDTFRIIALGDSFTFGYFVNTKDNWTEVLETELNKNLPCNYKKLEIINLGMAGFDIQQIVAMYKKVGKKYNPDLIIWFESSAGFRRFNEEKQPLMEKCFEEEKIEDIPEQEKYDVHYRCALKASEEVLNRYSFEDRQKIIQKNYDNFFAIYKQKKTLFFYYEEENNEMIETWKKKYPEAGFLTIVKDPKDGRFIDEHPNEIGHQAIANSIYNYLIDSEILCSK